MKNLEIGQIFREIVKILEIKGDNPFRIRAYERAAQNIESLAEDIEVLASQNRLSEIPGVGKDLSEKIKEYLSCGKIKFYQKLRKSIPPGLLELLDIPSVGPKTVKLLYENLKIKNIVSLEKAIKQNKLQGVIGIKEKTVENILEGIRILKLGLQRLTLGDAQNCASGFVGALEKLPQVKLISTAGSLRRQKETVRDIDILAISDKPEIIMDKFTTIDAVKDVLAKGRTKASVRTKLGVQVDCRVVEKDSFGAALMYFTGSKNFNIKLRQIAIKKGLKINEYGVFRKEKFIAGKTEEEIFKLLGLDFVEPELREDAGEIELAKEHNLPQLVQLKDLKGDLHAHSTWSDGINSIEEMADAAKKLGYFYITITDHSQSLKIASGLSTQELKKKKIEIDKLNSKLKGIRVLYGTEADILSDGSIDYKDEILKEFDVVIAAIHTGFKQSKEQLTKRIIRACQNKFVNIIAHPTGKLWGEREAYDLDFEQIFNVARETNTCLEINAYPQRLDLSDVHCRRAKELGVKLAIGTDSHSIQQLQGMKYGVAVARRGWLEKKDVINTLPLEELLKKIKK